MLDDMVRRIVQRFHPWKIVLFGSQAHGQPTVDSDVDLLVVMDSDEPPLARIPRVAEAAHVPYLPMDVIVRTPAEIEERLRMGDFFLAGILDRGKVLYERTG